MSKSYLITRDLVPTLKNRLNIEINKEISAKVKRLEEEFIEKMWSFVNEDDTHNILDTDEISNDVLSMLKNEERPVICFDDVHFSDIADEYFSITRLTDPANPKNYIFGPRPGHLSFPEQLSKIKREIGKKDIAILDVGAFKGTSIIEPLYDFKSKGLNPSAIYLGLAGRSAIDHLASHGLRPHVAHSYDFDDWIELRDLFGIDGRKVDQSKIDFTGIECYRGERLYMPYRENPEDWASIVPGKHNEFVGLCDEYFSRLQEILCEQEINIGLVEVTKPKFGIYHLDIKENE